MEEAHSVASPLGRITISSEAIAHIAARVAAESYGVVGMSARGLARLRPRDRLRQGITVTHDGVGDGAVKLELHVVVEHGLNLAEVASALRSRVAYEVARLTGLEVASVEVHIEDVRRSD